MKKLFENIFVSGQINASDFEALSDAGVKTIINNRPDHEEPNQLSSEHASELADQYQIDYHYLPMANGQPLPPTLVADFKAVLDSTKEPVLVHCRSGMRSSLLWALGQIPLSNISVDNAIDAAQSAGIPLANARALLESVKPK